MVESVSRGGAAGDDAAGGPGGRRHGPGGEGVMLPLRQAWDKLKGRSLAELRVRGMQALAARAERYGWSEQARVPDDAAFFARIDGSRVGRVSLSAAALRDQFRTRATPV